MNFGIIREELHKEVPDWYLIFLTFSKYIKNYHEDTGILGRFCVWYPHLDGRFWNREMVSLFLYKTDLLDASNRTVYNIFKKYIQTSTDSQREFMEKLNNNKINDLRKVNNSSHIFSLLYTHQDKDMLETFRPAIMERITRGACGYFCR